MDAAAVSGKRGTDVVMAADHRQSMPAPQPVPGRRRVIKEPHGFQADADGCGLQAR